MTQRMSRGDFALQNTDRFAVAEHHSEGESEYSLGLSAVVTVSTYLHARTVQCVCRFGGDRQPAIVWDAGLKCWMLFTRRMLARISCVMAV